MKTIDITRIVKGFDYFWNLPPSKFNPGTKLLLTEYLKLIRPLIDMYSEYTKKENNGDEKLYQEAKKLFE